MFKLEPSMKVTGYPISKKVLALKFGLTGQHTVEIFI